MKITSVHFRNWRLWMWRQVLLARVWVLRVVWPTLESTLINLGMLVLPEHDILF